MSIIPNCITESALAADRATEQEWQKHKEDIRRFENKIIGVCVVALIIIWVLEIGVKHI